MILIIAAWIYFFLLSLCLGFGLSKAVSKFANTKDQIVANPFYTFLLGYVFLIALLQILSLFLPIGYLVFVTTLIVGVSLVGSNYKSAFKEFSAFTRKANTSRGYMLLSVILVFVLLLAYSANREVDHADTFIYHFNAVKWVKDYSIVPGLANLHGRLGFNSSFFLFAALTDLGIYSNESAHIAVSFLLIICIIHWITIVFDPNEYTPKRIFCFLTFPYLIIHSTWKGDINSLSTDFPTTVLLLEFCLILLDKTFKHKSILLLPLAATILTFKLSGMLAVGLAVVVLTGNLLEWKFEFQNKVRHKAVIISSLILFTTILIGFFVRNAIISGWLIYPFPIGNLHLPWSVPKEYVFDMMNWIKSYPKIPGGVSPTIINENGFFYWFSPWYMQFRDLLEFKLFCVSLLLIFFSFLNLQSILQFFLSRSNHILLLIFAISNLIFWFLSAPDMRFGSVYFFILAGAAFALLYESTEFKKSIFAIALIIFVYLTSHYSRFVIDRNPMLFTFTYTKPLKLNKILASPPGENPPLYIYMPAEGDACGNSPLPCSPYTGGRLHENRGVRQRVPGDFSKGFLPLSKE